MSDSTRFRAAAKRIATACVVAASLLGLAALDTQPAQAAPTQEDVDRARDEEERAASSVAQIEVELAQAAARAQEANVQAALASEQLLAAEERLEEAKQAASSAREEAAQAHRDFEESLKELGSIAQFTYRSGSASLDSLAPYLESDGLRSLERRRNAVSQFGGAADTKMQKVAALQQVADIMDDAAASAEQTEQEAYADVAAKTDELKAQAEYAEQVAAETAETRERLVEELAVKHNTTVELEKERLEESERIRKQEEAAAAQAAAEAAAAAEEAARPKPGGGSGTSGGTGSGTSGGGEWTPPPVAPPASGSVQTVIDFARSKIGAPYWWGGNGPGYDCSGIVYMAYQQVGIVLPRTAAGQYNAGRRVPISSAQPGDLVFWASGGSIYHVALVSGPGRIISAHMPGVPLDEGPWYTTGDMLGYAVRIL